MENKGVSAAKGIIHKRTRQTWWHRGDNVNLDRESGGQEWAMNPWRSHQDFCEYIPRICIIWLWGAREAYHQKLNRDQAMTTHHTTNTTHMMVGEGALINWLSHSNRYWLTHVPLLWLLLVESIVQIRHLETISVVVTQAGRCTALCTVQHGLPVF